MGCAGPHSLTDVVASDQEVVAVIAFAADKDMDMGIVGVPVIDAEPIEPRAEIAFNLRHRSRVNNFKSANCSASSDDTMNRK